MALPWEDPLDELYGYQQPTTQPIAPLAEQESEFLLERLGSKTLGGLGWLGSALDKTFGGRAVRGLLGGKPEELLSVLPFSDTLGITDPQNIVYGKELLGLPKESEGFGEDDVQGILAEIALDPATWIGAAVPKMVLKGLNVGAKGAGKGVEYLTRGNFNPYTLGQKGVGQAKRIGRALFDEPTQGTWLEPIQNLASTEYTPQLKAGQEAAKLAHLESISPLDEIIKGTGLARETPEFAAKRAALNRGATQAAQGFDTEARASLAAAGYTPAEIDTIVGVASREAEQVRTIPKLEEQPIGLISKESTDVQPWLLELRASAAAAGQTLPPELERQFAQYVPHNLAEIPGETSLGLKTREGLTGVSSHQIAREDVYKGIPGGIVGLNDLARSEQFSGAGRKLQDLEVENKLSQMLTGHSAGQMPASWQGIPGADKAWEGSQAQVKELSRRMKAYPDVVRQHGLFSEDVFSGLLGRRLESARVKASGNTIVRGLTDPNVGAVRKIEDLEKAGEQYIRVPEFLNQTGLSHIDELGRPVAGAKVAEVLGIDTRAVGDITKNLNQYGIPIDVAKDMLRIGQAWKTPSSLQPVVSALDTALQSFKDFVTFPFPAYSVRNLLSGIFDKFRGGAMSNQASSDALSMIRGGTISDATAAKLYPGLSAKAATVQLRNDLMASELAFARTGVAGEKIGTQAKTINRNLQAGDLPSVGGEVRPVGEDIAAWLGGNKPSISKGNINPLKSEEFFPVKTGRQLTNTIEDWLRGSHYISKRLEGMDHAAAKLEVLKYQRDYSAMTQFEQNVMRRLFPWYAFSRRNLPPILEDLATKPAKLAGSIRTATSGQREGFSPPWLKEGTAISLGEGAPGYDRYLAGLGLPFEDEAVRALANLASGKPTRTVQGLIGSAAPIVKYPLEEAFGVQAHSGRRLEDLRPSLAAQQAGELAEGAGLGQIDTRALSSFLGATPATRAISTVGKIADERKDTEEKLANLLTGFWVTDVDASKARQLSARDYIENMLRGDQNVTNWEKFYVPPEKAAAMDPAQLELYRLYKALEIKAQKAAAQRRASGITNR